MHSSSCKVMKFGPVTYTNNYPLNQIRPAYLPTTRYLSGRTPPSMLTIETSRFVRPTDSGRAFRTRWREGGSEAPKRKSPGEMTLVIRSDLSLRKTSKDSPFHTRLGDGTATEVTVSVFFGASRNRSFYQRQRYVPYTKRAIPSRMAPMHVANISYISCLFR